MARTFAVLIVLAFFVGSLGACSPRVIYKDRIVEVKVPVAQPCASQRPAPVPPLSSIPDREWQAMDIVQKTAAVGEQGFRRQGYGEQLDAATAACP